MKLIYILGFSALLISCGKYEVTNPPSAKVKKPKNIILLIGDGTGLSQVSAAQFYKKEPVNYERFPIVGLIKVSSSDELIPDSAAAATAFASGKKTANGVIGMDTEYNSLETIIDLISKKGMHSGLIATSSITHATPACFYAHVKNRNSAEDIAAFLPESDIDYFAASGLKYFNNRKDGKNLITQFELNDFVIDTLHLNPHSGAKKIGYLLARKDMPTMLEGRGNFLPDATEMAMKFLSHDNKGFFLMAEGSQIDWGGHDNQADYLISELIDFDNTLGVVLDFAKHDGETLVVVTADHETGGFSLGYQNGDYNTIVPSFSTTHHTGAMVPVFAFGPGAENFGGIYENTEIFEKLKALIQD